MTLHQHQSLFIAGPAGRLQAILQRGEASRPVVVVCHPHPLYGGTMRNKVVYWMARAFEERGCSVVCFNFRGVERSEGRWDEGVGEAADAAAVLDWAADHFAGLPLWLAGFSFGCYAGLRAARRDRRVARMFAVAPAVNLWSFDFMAGESRPITVVAGTADEIVPFEQVQASVQGKPNIHFHPIAGAGHFFPDHMAQMQQALLADIREW